MSSPTISAVCGSMRKNESRKRSEAWQISVSQRTALLSTLQAVGRLRAGRGLHPRCSPFADSYRSCTESADVILTVPAAWDAAGCQLMRNAAINAGMVQSARAGDRSWRERLRIIT
jgi:hypothetical protein